MRTWLTFLHCVVVMFSQFDNYEDSKSVNCLEVIRNWYALNNHEASFDFKLKITFWCSHCGKPFKNDISFHYLKLSFCLEDKYENCINNFDILYYLSVITYFVSITVPTLMCQKYQLPQFLKTSGKYKE